MRKRLSVLPSRFFAENALVHLFQGALTGIGRFQLLSCVQTKPNPFSLGLKAFA